MASRLMDLQMHCGRRRDKRMMTLPHTSQSLYQLSLIPLLCACGMWQMLKPPTRRPFHL